MSFGFDVLALLALGGFYLATRASRPRRWGDRRPPQRQAERPVAGAKPAWAIAREKRAVAEGKRGEELVQRALHELQLPALHDIMLEDDKGPTQVDHLVKTPWGVAVLETKHYSGFIFGNPSGAMWTQRFCRGDEIYDTEFRSPVRQNYRHTKAVEHVIKGLGVSVEGFVVFSSSATIGDTVKDSVVSPSELGQKLWALDRPRAEPANLEIAWTRLQQVSIRAEGRRGEHLAMVKARSAQQPGSFT
ncbi:MAG: nuclease-related domain-containing protein [Janthinobacterium lividum]